MPLAAAVVASSVIGAGTAAYGASQSKKAAKKANAAQQAAADKQLAAQQANFDRISGMNAPFVQGGQQAYAALLQEFGITPGGRAPAAPSGPATYDRSGNIVPMPGPATVAAAKSAGGSAGTLPAEPDLSGADLPGNRTSVVAATGFGGYNPIGVAPGGGGAPQPTTSGAPDYAAYLAANPDVGAEFTRLQGTREGQAHLQSLGVTNPTQFAQYHATTFGQGEGRTIPTAAAQAPPQVQDPMAGAPQRPQAQQAPDYARPQDLAQPDYGDAPGLDGFFQNFEADPGYQFRQTEALRGVNAASAVRGKLRSGDAAKALQSRSSDLASQEYGNWFARQMQKYQATRSAYDTDRNFSANQYQYGQNRNDKHFADDRAYDTSLWQYGTQRGDQNFETDRSYADSRGDRQTDNLFRLTGVGLQGAGNVAGAGTNNANAQSAIYGNQADATSQNAYARANANAGLAGNLGGAASNLFAAWGGSSGGGGMGGTTAAQAWNNSFGGGWQTAASPTFVNTPSSIGPVY